MGRVLASREAAKIWIIENQFGRRNLDKYARGVLALQLEDMYKAEAERRQAEYHGNQYESGHSQKSDEVQTHIRTDEQIAKLAGMSRDVAKLFIIDNQLRRRNLSRYARSVLALQLEPLYQAEAKRRQATSTGGKPHRLAASHIDWRQVPTAYIEFCAT